MCKKNYVKIEFQFKMQINHEYLTPENKAFLKEVVEDKYNVNVQREPGINIEWTPKMQRTGLIARKIGIYPLWFQNGKRIQTTLLQVRNRTLMAPVKH